MERLTLTVAGLGVGNGTGQKQITVEASTQVDSLAPHDHSTLLVVNLSTCAIMLTDEAAFVALHQWHVGKRGNDDEERAHVRIGWRSAVHTYHRCTASARAVSGPVTVDREMFL